MKSELRYKPDLTNPESFIVYKFSIMPKEVITSKNIFSDSNALLFMNSEFVRFVNQNFENESFHNAVDLRMLLIIKKIIKESIDFHHDFDQKSQNFSKKYKHRRLTLESFAFKRWKNDLRLAKYICKKEAYDLEIPYDRIMGYDIVTAHELLEKINYILGEYFNFKNSIAIKKGILSDLRRDLKANRLSKTLEIGLQQLYDANVYRALVCSNEIIELINALNHQNKLTQDSIIFCIELINLGISAKNGTTKKARTNLIKENDLETFDKEKASKLKNELILKNCRTKGKAIRLNYSKKTM